VVANPLPASKNNTKTKDKKEARDLFISILQDEERRKAEFSCNRYVQIAGIQRCSKNAGVWKNIVSHLGPLTFKPIRG
jgi:hypothetical protein